MIKVSGREQIVVVWRIVEMVGIGRELLITVAGNCNYITYCEMCCSSFKKLATDETVQIRKERYGNILCTVHILYAMISK